MLRLILLLAFVLCQVASSFSASIPTTEYYDYYEYSEEYSEEEVETRIQMPRSRVLFEDDEFVEESDSSAINYKDGDEKSNLSDKISFINPEDRLAKIEMTLQE
eukprot:TRINITY_DN30773_c0_g1_i1.p1 TRINITY_DN30773_c0_g1~~TRINITY_DN30773_c0_g1_i1.p1  ORF type:complete len:104 (+),score=21.39 TRINITY_DN30773_c0_g1_i1:67-378(+)